jgi:hypothetical protein
MLTWPSLGMSKADTTKAAFFIKMASLPGSTIANIPVPFRGRTLQLAGDRTFDPWSITVINDVGMDIRKSFEGWMNAMNTHVSNKGEVRPSSYKATMTVTQLKKDGTTGRSYQIQGAFPTAVGAIELDYGAENAIEEFSVEFQLDYWTTADSTDQSGQEQNLGGLAGGVAGGGLLGGFIQGLLGG